MKISSGNCVQITIHCTGRVLKQNNELSYEIVLEEEEHYEISKRLMPDTGLKHSTD